MEPAQKNEIMEQLHKCLPELQKCGVTSIALFGSVLRGEAGPDSDVDLLVEFGRPIGLLAFIRLQHRLEEILARPVDLVTPKALKKQWRDRIIQEAAHARQRLEI